MLDIVRKHATSWLIKVALFLIAIVFIFWGGYSFTSREGSRIAEVNGRVINNVEYNNAYQNMVDMYRQQLGSAFSEKLLRSLNLKALALNMLITRYVIADAAENLQLTATTAEVRHQIMQYPVFKVDGKFNDRRYVAVLRENHLTPAAFEKKVATDVTMQNVRNFITRQAVVTNREVRTDFLFNNSRIKLHYVQVNPQDFQSRVSVDGKALQAFYKSHKNLYMEPEKRQFALVDFKTDDYLNQVKVTPPEIRQYYADNQKKYEQKEAVQARHILFRVAENAPKEKVAKVRAEALKVLAMAHRKGADFAALAKKYSQGPTASSGGELGYFTRSQVVPAFGKAAFQLKPGQISGLVRTRFGFHIIKVQAVRPARVVPLKEVQDQIKLALERQKAGDIAHNKSRDFSDLAYSEKSVAKAAKQDKLSVVVSKQWFSVTDSPPALQGSKDGMRKLFALSDKDVSTALKTPQGYVVAQVLGIKAPELAPFAKVKDRVTADCKAAKARKLAEKKAAALLVAARKSRSLEQAAEENHFQVKSTDWFSRLNPDKQLGLQENALNQVSRLEMAQPFPQAPLAVETSTGPTFVVCQLAGREQPSKGAFEKQRPLIAQRLLQEKQDELWRTWANQQRKAAKIEIFKEP